MTPARTEVVFFFFNDTATTEIYTLSLHDALPISGRRVVGRVAALGGARRVRVHPSGDAVHADADRKSTRLNSSHANISYAVFCLKKKKKSILSLPGPALATHNLSTLLLNFATLHA